MPGDDLEYGQHWATGIKCAPDDQLDHLMGGHL